MAEELFEEDEIITLTDEDGKEERFIVLCVIEYKGKEYYALLPEVQTDDEDGYVILRADEEEGESMLVTIDDDAEFDEVADQIDEYLNSEIDFDEGGEE